MESHYNDAIDRTLHAELSKYLGWFSPAAATLAFSDWWIHLMISPAKRYDIYQHFYQSYLSWLKDYCVNCKEGVAKEKCDLNDVRFKHPSWESFPFSYYANIFLMIENACGYASQNIPGVSKHHQQVVHFLIRQYLDVLSPSNIAWLNPEIIEKTLIKNGENLVNGFYNFIDDYLRFATKSPAYGTEQFKVGKDVAITPGQVVYSNSLIELIQYSPSTATVHKEPILIVPAWIMKYYILDLSKNNSMVKHLVSQGHTVFMISWKNPDSSYRDFGLNMYVNLGVMEALNVINKIVPNTKINTVGYCIGGTLLMIAAAAMAGNNDERISSITLFAAQIDFKDAGELTTFIDASQVSYLEDIMWEKGYLDGSQMSGAFSMLHSTELIWSRFVHDYLLGDRKSPSDIMSWDMDTTRLPYRMHSEYLHKLFLNNELVQGQYAINDKLITLSNISVPIFAVGTITDHVAPWISVYKVHLFVKSDITFVLTSGGHNVGIVNPPEESIAGVQKSYQKLTSLKTDKRLTYDQWRHLAPNYPGSWWPAWYEWLNGISPVMTPLPEMGDRNSKPQILYPAPGKYVLE